MARHAAAACLNVIRNTNNISLNFHKNCFRPFNLTLSKKMIHADGVRYRKPFTVFVEGNIGCGKTTFLSKFNNVEAQILSEPVDLWRNVRGNNLLGKLYEDSKRWGFLFQSYVQLTMLDLHLSQSQHSLKLMERSLHSARHCFVENLYRNKVISEAELSVLDQWYRWILSHTDVEGDLVVYLRCSPEVAARRVAQRGRGEEAGVPLNYLRQLHELHEEWLVREPAAAVAQLEPHPHSQAQPQPQAHKPKVIIVDVNRDLEDMEEEFIEIKNQIVTKYTQQMDRLLI